MANLKQLPEWKYFKLPVSDSGTAVCYLCGDTIPCLSMRSHLLQKHKSTNNELDTAQVSFATRLPQVYKNGTMYDRDADMYRNLILQDLIKQQIQLLVTQLASSGVESVLLMATMSDAGTTLEDDFVVGSELGHSVVGSELGQLFLSNCNHVKIQFQDYCSSFQTDIKSNHNHYVSPVRCGKRSSEEMNELQSSSTDISLTSLEESPSKRSRSPLIKTEPQSEEDVPPSQGHASMQGQSSTEGHFSSQGHFSSRGHLSSSSQEQTSNKGHSSIQGHSHIQGHSPSQGHSSATDSTSLEMLGHPVVDSNLDIPKGVIKCCVCDYMSRFRANVTRHERSKHGFHVDGSASPTVNYACSICHYKSPYRSNLIRHEKTVHKVFSSSFELDSRKIPATQASDYYDIKPVHLYPEFSNQSDREESQNYTNIQHLPYANNDLDDLVDRSPLVVKPCDQLWLKEGSNQEPCDQVLPSMCSFCEETFDSSDDLRMHVNAVHTDMKDISCSRCDPSRMFKDVQEYCEHMITSHGTS